MRLLPKIKVPEFERYDGITDPRHNFRRYRGKMLSYWDYEEFIIHTFRDSLTGAALDWYMSLKATDIPTWADLSSKFIDQYRYCAETPPTLLELNTTEMTKGQSFEAYAAKWRAAVAKHKKEGESSKKAAVGTSFTRNKKANDAFVNAVNPGYQAPPPQSTQSYTPPPAHHHQQHPAQQVYYSALPQQYVHNYAPAPPSAQQNRPPASRTPQPTQRAPAPKGQQLLASGLIKPVALGPNFDLAAQNPNLRCEYHSGAPGHTLNNCWQLWDKIQELVEKNAIAFNAVKPPNVHANPFPDHGSSSGPTINMISICAKGEEESKEQVLVPFIIEYVPTEVAVASAPFVIEVPTREPYQDNRVPWNYEGGVANLEQQMSVIGVTRLGRLYENPAATNKGKAPATALEVTPLAAPIPQKKVTEEEAEAFMKVIKASEYKIVEQMGKSPTHISLMALLLSSEPHREALLKVLTSAQVPKEIAPDMIEETVSSIFSSNISFLDDELPSERYKHTRALHIVCKCNRFIIGRVMINNGSALNVLPVSTLKQMNVDMSRIKPGKTAVRAFDGSRREVNGEIDLLIEVGLCSFSVTFQVLDIPNAFSLLLGRPWIHSAGALPSSLHQKLKFIAEDKLITVKGECQHPILAHQLKLHYQHWSKL
ncbi:hypothetical protein CRG98_040751 [Punica granatum]|uniref:Retrotransposon gag domain-containing protein n=1 Tax=Punica granatum TaxID=22663 RepID=A0A2I0I4G3_PUNGR|nr:hypothetical protein CRG98_040751 [Punica granatum]